MLISKLMMSCDCNFEIFVELLEESKYLQKQFLYPMLDLKTCIRLVSAETD